MILNKGNLAVQLPELNSSQIGSIREWVKSEKRKSIIGVGSRIFPVGVSRKTLLEDDNHICPATILDALDAELEEV